MTLVVGLAGMPGSGKTLVARDLQSRFGYRCVGLSTFLVEARENRSDPQATIRRWSMARDIRARLGPQVLAERAWEVMKEDPGPFVVDGIRTLEECAYFSRRCEYFLAVFQRPPALRYERLKASKRTSLFRSDPSALSALDKAELDLGLGRVIAEAEFIYFSAAGESELVADASDAAGEIHASVESRGSPGSA